MALVDLWERDRTQILEKHLRQLIGFAGEGRLLDGNQTSAEWRALLRIAPSDLIQRWVDELIAEAFDDGGFALQDIVNEIGSRLGFDVTNGVYRGRRDGVNFDGFWQSPEGRGLVVESKTSTTYQIDISKIAEYWRHRPDAPLGGSEEAAVLLVVGRSETEALESQIRGSRHAWVVRLIGIDALIRLLKLKETLNDPAVERQIRNILFPQEFTRLDRIVDLVFETSEDIQEESDSPALEDDGAEPKRKPAGFHSLILPKLEKYIGQPLVKRARVLWTTPDRRKLLSCQVASSREIASADALFWFGLKRKTAETLNEHVGAMSAFGLGSDKHVIVVPYELIAKKLPGFFTSPDEDGSVLHWHVRFVREGEKFYLLTNRDRERVDVTKYYLR
ncbi:MAG: hypothetical protein AMXMBFR47_15560 [Planctomycetota bacterium]